MEARIVWVTPYPAVMIAEPWGRTKTVRDFPLQVGRAIGAYPKPTSPPQTARVFKRLFAGLSIARKERP